MMRFIFSAALRLTRGGELFVNNDKLYHVLHQCFWIFNEQLAGSEPFHLHFVPHFQGDIGRFSRAVTGVAFRNDTDSSTSTFSPSSQKD